MEGMDGREVQDIRDRLASTGCVVAIAASLVTNIGLMNILKSRFDRSEILLLGTGSTVLPPPPELRSYISSLGIQLDIMDSVSLISTVSLFFPVETDLT